MTGETHSENGPLSFKIPKWISGRWEEKGLNWKEEREVLSNEVFGDKGEFDGAKKF